MKLGFPLLLAVALVSASPAAWAEGAPSIEATLAANAGKKVSLRLGSGEELSGTLVSTSPVTVKLAELAGKEFYEAVVRIDQIAAVIVRTPGK